MMISIFCNLAPQNNQFGTKKNCCYCLYCCHKIVATIIVVILKLLLRQCCDNVATSPYLQRMNDSCWMLDSSCQQDVAGNYLRHCNNFKTF